MDMSRVDVGRRCTGMFAHLGWDHEHKQKKGKKDTPISTGGQRPTWADISTDVDMGGGWFCTRLGVAVLCNS